MRPAKSILDDPGPAAHWAPATREICRQAYGRWLSFVRHLGLLQPGSDPAARVRPELVQRYIATLRCQLASYTVWSYVDRLYSALAAMAPDRDWRWLRRAVNRLQRHTVPVRNVEGLLRPSSQIYRSGLRLMRRAELDLALSEIDRAVQFRDGLMLALLTARPVRLRNYASILLGNNLWRSEAGYTLRFKAEETKTRHPIEVALPHGLRPFMDTYLERYRPILLQQDQTDRLWISKAGRAMSQNSVAHRIRKLTKRHFGQSISPHFFRHCAGTTIAAEAPSKVGIVMPVLGHSQLSTGERYYIQSRSIEAGRRHQAHLEQLRRRLMHQCSEGGTSAED